MPVPARGLFVLLAAALAAAVPASLAPELYRAWAGLLGAGLGLALLDAVRLWLSPVPELRREVAGSLALGRWQRVDLRLVPRGTARLRLEVFDHHPPGFETEHMPRTLGLEPGQEAAIWYRLHPTERGEHRFSGVQLRVHSPWSLWKRSVFLPLEQRVRVYPNFGLVTKYMLLAGDDRLGQMGVHRRIRRGQGLEFHQLREYRQGDSIRQIDWKNSARLRRLIAREYQEERDQELVVLLDCSRRMRARDQGISHFDACLNAVLLLSYVALRQGDGVGLATFGGEQRWLPPAKGRGDLRRLLDSVYDLEPSNRVPDYLEASATLLAKQRKRALIILLTNLRDEDADDLGPAVRALGRRHLVLVVNLREPALEAALEHPVRAFEDALRTAAVHVYRRDQREALKRLRAQGVEHLDLAPQKLSVELVNCYLEIKAGGRL